MSCVSAAALLAVMVATPPMVAVGPGSYRPIYAASVKEQEVPLPAFSLDVAPVTNAAFLEFVKANPLWRRDRVRGLFADPGYLKHWAGPLDPGTAGEQAPVIWVSWFAAQAYCAARGARLPTEAQWEFAAAADETQLDARRTPAFRERLLAWYSRPNPPRPPQIRQGKPNAWGVYDLHGVVWEWVLDFGSTLIAGDSRDGNAPRGRQFCGAGASSASEKDDYAGFMRIAFRSSLEANYTVGNLGFRCARDPGAQQ